MGKQLLITYAVAYRCVRPWPGNWYDDAEANLQKGYLRERYPLARVGIHDADAVSPSVFAPGA